MDEDSIREALFLEGPETVIALNVPSTALSGQDLLSSPGFRGFVKGALTFERINLTDLNPSTARDTTGAGNLYRTRAVFTPTSRLPVNTLLRAYLSGDEDITDTRRVGARTRTVFDTVAAAGNTGDGVTEFRGGFNGSAVSDTFNVSISTAGEAGEAEFRWYRSSAPAILHGPIRTLAAEATELEDGVRVRFTGGSYRVSDLFSAAVRRATTYEGNVVWEFTTGSGAITQLPTTTSTSVIGDVAAPLPPSAPLSVVSIDPSKRATNQPLHVASWLVTFNKNLDAGSVTPARVSVIAEPAVGIVNDPVPSGQNYTANLIPTLLVSGQTLRVSVPSGELYRNNVLTLVLDQSLLATDGSAMVEDYQSYFTTLYDPLYCSTRQIRLRIGSFLEKVPDDTINLAILEASRTADLMATLGVANTQHYRFARSQWTCCKATEILLNNLLGAGGGLRSKRLGDLEVSYAANDRANIALQAALECMARWERVVMGGGNQVANPQVFIRGWTDPDKPLFGRLWISDTEGRGIPAVNIRKAPVGARKVYRGWTRNPRGHIS